MWVEIKLQKHWLIKKQGSSSSWGCELKYQGCKWYVTGYGHPLREDVSWNATMFDDIHLQHVILFVRMWVEIHLEEIPLAQHSCHPLREDVSWNYSQLFYTTVLKCHPLREDVSWNVLSTYCVVPAPVILFVRMWVEISLMQHLHQWTLSSSSWGCELKWLV